MFIEPETSQGRVLSARLAGQVEFLGGDGLAALVGKLERAWRVTRTTGAVQGAARDLVSSLSGTFVHVPSDPRILQAIDYIRARSSDTPSLEEVARAVHLSPSRFRHVFVEETGMPLRTYQLWRRLLRAWEFLMQGDNLVSAAHAAGFADSAHLSHVQNDVRTGTLGHANERAAERAAANAVQLFRLNDRAGQRAEEGDQIVDFMRRQLDDLPLRLFVAGSRQLTLTEQRGWCFGVMPYHVL